MDGHCRPAAMKWGALTLPVLLFLLSDATADDFSARVVSILDGDTIQVLYNNLTERIRLNGIDCPEKGQPFGKKAKQATSDLVFGKEVRLLTHGKDKYGRTIADVFLQDGTNINQMLVKDGWCWWYRKYAPGNVVLEELERRARSLGIGLWADPAPIPPWVYRGRKRNLTIGMMPKKSGAHSVRGTLIGTFITSTSIVIAADSAVSERNKFLQEADKTCRPSPRSVATIQGEYGIPLSTSDESIFLFNLFKRECFALYKRTELLPLEKQANEIIESLRLYLQRNLDYIDPKRLETYAKNANHINYVSVSGYVNNVPKVYVRELLVEKTSAGRWKAMTRERPNLSPEFCGARFHGDAKIANQLLQGSALTIIPGEEFRREEVIAARVANETRNCISFSHDQAWKLFETAVSLTQRYGWKMNMPKDVVGGRLNCWSIAPTGKAEPCIASRVR